MGRRGDAYDNAVAESFFASLETELLDRTSFATRNQARSAVFGYIEGFYNPHRRHSTIGYHSPADYERRPQPGVFAPISGGDAGTVQLAYGCDMPS